MPRIPEQIWQAIGAAQLSRPDVTGGTGFGRSEGLRVSAKIFAMLVKGELVVKLPKDRVDDLAASGLWPQLRSRTRKANEGVGCRLAGSF